MSLPLRFKRNDAFQLTGQALGADGQPVSLTGVTIAAKVRLPGMVDPVDTLVPMVVDAGLGTYSLKASGDGTAKNWPVGLLVTDIEFKHANWGPVSTEDIYFEMLEDQT